MDVKSTYKFARISARKARDVAREIQGLPVSDALDLLSFTPRKGAELFAKTMKTALADAENNFELPVEGLFVKSAVVGEGPTFKRFKPRARGSASAILKRTSHITVILSDEVSETGQSAAKTSSKSRSGKAAAKPAAAAAKATAPATGGAAKEKKADSPGNASGENEQKAGTKVDEVLGMVYDSPPPEIDDLKEINGVGPALEEKLNSVGIYKFEQIANWTEEQVAGIDDLLSFGGRIEREEWIAKAQALHGK